MGIGRRYAKTVGAQTQARWNPSYATMFTRGRLTFQPLGGEYDRKAALSLVEEGLDGLV